VSVLLKAGHSPAQACVIAYLAQLPLKEWESLIYFNGV
jgi:hypothetical protein